MPNLPAGGGRQPGTGERHRQVALADTVKRHLFNRAHVLSCDRRRIDLIPQHTPAASSTSIDNY